MGHNHFVGLSGNGWRHEDIWAWSSQMQLIHFVIICESPDNFTAHSYMCIVVIEMSFLQ